MATEKLPKKKSKKEVKLEAKMKYLEDLKVVRNLLFMLDKDLSSSGDLGRLSPENQEYWKRVMTFAEQVYENNPKYQS